ncbi:PilZ domain-containing protein [Myxococcaceae bacterium GXIMD 01537]
MNEQQQQQERRAHLRFDKLFTVYLSTREGMTRGIGRNISMKGMFVETREPMPLGEAVKVTFAGEDGTEMTALCEVRYQVALSYGRKDGREGNSRGVGLRIVAYEVQEDAPLLLVDRERVMH